MAFTGRAGGVSRGRFATLNLAGRVGDHPAAVQENRRRAAGTVGADVDTLVLMRQVHGAAGAEVHHDPSAPHAPIPGDFLVVRRAGVTPLVLVADCVPVVLQGDRGVAVAHAGWRGIVAGVVEAAAEALGGVERAWVGPSIRACCYEVGAEVTDAFAARNLPVAGERRVDPPDAVVAILKRGGIEDVACSDICTRDDDRYFSFRRDRHTGRQGALVTLLAG